MLKKAPLLFAATVAASVCLSACGSSDSAGSSAEGGKLKVVASTNVYGNVAAVVGGSEVDVTSILTNPDQDPHSFEANPKTALKISQADLVIENGGGYDDYMDTLIKSSKSKATVINVVDVSGKKAPTGGELNEHIWYDFPSMKLVVDKIVVDLSKEDPENAATFSANADGLKAELDALIAREADLKADTAGKAIGITEPVPLYLTDALGLINKTPGEFSEAIEEGEDVPAKVLDETLDLYRDKTVAALIYNEQTSGPVTEKVKAAAEAGGVSVVPVTETLPDDQDYIQWMTANLDAVAQAVGK